MENPFEKLELKIDERFNELKLLIEKNHSSEIPDEFPYLHSLKELADFLHCSIVTVQKLKNSKDIPYHQVGRKVIFKKSDVLAAMVKNPFFKKKKIGKDGNK